MDSLKGKCFSVYRCTNWPCVAMNVDHDFLSSSAFTWYFWHLVVQSGPVPPACGICRVCWVVWIWQLEKQHFDPIKIEFVACVCIVFTPSTSPLPSISLPSSLSLSPLPPSLSLPPTPSHHVTYTVVWPAAPSRYRCPSLHPSPTTHHKPSLQQSSH